MKKLVSALTTLLFTVALRAQAFAEDTLIVEPEPDDYRNFTGWLVLAGYVLAAALAVTVIVLIIRAIVKAAKKKKAAKKAEE